MWTKNAGIVTTAVSGPCRELEVERLIWDLTARRAEEALGEKEDLQSRKTLAVPVWARCRWAGHRQ